MLKTLLKALIGAFTLILVFFVAAYFWPATRVAEPGLSATPRDREYAAVETTTQTVVIFVNGIHNSLSEAEASRDTLATIVAEAGLPIGGDRGLYRAELFYNPSYPGADLIEASRQILAVYLNWNQAVSVARDLASSIQVHLDAGRNVILVAHSQGNLMVQQALPHLEPSRSRWPDGSPRYCVGVVGLASPVYYGWLFPAYDVDKALAITGFIVGGDIIANRVNRGFQYLTTDSTRAATERSQRISRADRVRLHGLQSSYFPAPESRDVIRQYLRTTHTVLEKRGCRS